MLEFPIPAGAKRILCLGAHSDDIEIGCGGALLKWASEGRNLEVHWIVFSGEGQRSKEARLSAKALLPKVRLKVAVEKFRTSFLPYEGGKVKESFEGIKGSFRPDIIFTHYREDRHQDHRLLSDLAWNTFRNDLILEYEIPKYDGDLGSPNFFVPLSEEIAKKKAGHLCCHFQTQSDKHWFSEETFLALMRLRGVECSAQYAEAFYCRKLICS